MTTPTEERERWATEWAREGDASIWGCPDMTWGVGVLRDLDMIVPHLGLDGATEAFVLDLGCGPGRLALRLARIYQESDWWVTGVDINPAVVGEANAAAAADKVPATFRVTDGRTIPVDHVPFDAAYSMLLWQHLPAEAVRGYLAEIAGVLKPGGRFRFQFVVGDTDVDYSHDHDPLDIMEWAADAGLSIVDCPARDPDWPTWAWCTAMLGS